MKEIIESTKKPLPEIFENTKIEKCDTVDNLKTSFISYAMAVNISRAIPDVRDGLKPVHRRILYAMGEMNNFYNNPTKKSARIVGEVMGKYHPHGDSAVYDSLVRLAQDFSIRYPLIDGQGNFGSVDGDPAAAQRYTEARLSKIAGLMLEDIDKNTVDFYPNFDNTLQQPVVLPSKFPNLLVNGSDGIAVGMATNIPPHNLTEVLNALEAMIDNPEIDIDELCKYVPAPDFPTAGIIMGSSSVKNAYKTGRGGVVVRGRAEIEEMANGKQRIVITELPYQVNKSQFIIQMVELVKNKRVEGISDIKEESDRDGMRIVVDVKKDANAQVVLNLLYKHTQLQKNIGIIFLSIVENTPRILNLKEMLSYYLEHQKEVLTRKTDFDLAKAKEREHIVKGLVIALSNIDEVIRVIKSADDKIDAVIKLTTQFELDDIQANAILEMKLSKLTSLEVEKLNEELRQLDATIDDLNDILAKPERLLSILKENFENVKAQYGDKRRTEISYELGGIDIADLIAKEDVIISMTHEGYIKRLSVDEYKAQKRGGMGVTAHKTKEEDFVENMFITCTHNDLLFFTNMGRVYSIKAYEVPEAQRTAKGRAIINLLQLSAGEKVTTVIPIENDHVCGNLIMATKKGLIKKTKFVEYASIRKVGKIAIKLVEGDELIDVTTSDGDDHILVASRQGKCIRFSEKDVREVGRDSQGVKSMKLSKTDEIVSMAVIKAGLGDRDEGAQIITITENGYGKRSEVNDYRAQSRGGIGVKAGVFNDKTGKLVALKQVMPNSDILLIADSGIVIRTPLDDITRLSRVSQGVRIMKLKNDAKIVSVALANHEEEENILDGENIVESDEQAIPEESNDITAEKTIYDEANEMLQQSEDAPTDEE